MKSMQRFWLSRSSSPVSVNVVGATGNTPLYRGEWDGLMASYCIAPMDSSFAENAGIARKRE
jgi:hypothetical protein